MKQKPFNHLAIKPFLATHWDELVILLITIILLGTIFVPFFLNNSLDKFDTPGLLSLSWFIKEYRFPDFSGWNPYFFAGLPQGVLYPPLFHWLVALFGQIFHLSVAYKLVVTMAAAFIPYSIYEFSLKVYKATCPPSRRSGAGGKSWSILNTLLILITLIILPGYFGFNFDGLIDYGLGPNFVTIPMFFGYLAVLFDKKFNWKLAGILFSLMLLTNLVAPLVAGLITAIWFVIRIKDSKKIFAKFVSFACIFALLTSFWALPFLAFRSYTVSGLPPLSSSMILVTASLISSFGSLAFAILKRNNPVLKTLPPIIIISTLISVLCLLTSVFDIYIPPVHPFRLQIFAFIGIATTLPIIIQSLHPIFTKLASKVGVMKYLKINLHLGMNFSFVIFVLFVLILIRISPTFTEEVNLKQDLSWEGRIARGYKVSEILDQSRSVIDRSVMENPDSFAVDGLLKESSYLAPYYQSLEKSLNPDNYDWEELDSNYLENYQVSEEKLSYLADLLWIKSVFTITTNFPNCSNYERVTSFKSNSLEEGVVKRDMYICTLGTPAGRNQNNQAEVLDSKPEFREGDWDENVGGWWKSNETSLFTEKELSNEFEYTYSYLVPEVEWANNYQSLKITTNNDKELPILLKVSYFPNWKAKDSEGNEVEIYRISPNLMALPVKNEITLSYERSLLEKITLAISIASWLGLITFSGYQFIRSKFKFKIEK
jgi:hypothetical protein